MEISRSPTRPVSERAGERPADPLWRLTRLRSAASRTRITSPPLVEPGRLVIALSRSTLVRAYAAAAGAIRTGRCARATEARQRLRFASRCGMATLVAAILSAVSKATRLGSGRSITIVATS